MPLGYYGSGNWFGLPEFGITELFGGKTGSLQTPSVLSASDYRADEEEKQTTSTPTAPATSSVVSGARVSSSAGSAGNEVAQRSSEIKSSKKKQEDAAKKQEEAFRAAIESEYNNVMRQLGSSEQSLRAQLPLTEQQIAQSYGEVVPQIEAERGQRLADLAGQETTARGETESVLNRARQVYNELLSGAGQFSGSAAQAYGELLGRQTAGTMGEARTNLANTITEIQGEVGRVRNFYDAKVTDLQQKKNLAVEQARQDFRNELSKIEQRRYEAGSAKASQKLSVLANFQQRMADIADAVTLQQQQLRQWAMERNAALAAAQQETIKQAQLGFTDIGKIASSVETTGSQFTPQGLAGVYGLYGQNPAEVDWQKIFGQTEPKEEEKAQAAGGNWWD